MVNDIVDGIVIKINNAFGDGNKIYTANVEQGMKLPCFFVKLLTTINSPLMGKRKKRDYPFDIHYFPEDETNNEKMMNIGDSLMEVLEYITLNNGDVLRGKDMEYQIIEGVLHFSVTYGCTLIDLSKGASMNDYSVDMGVISDGK